jgi:hypothetical protein
MTSRPIPGIFVAVALVLAAGTVLAADAGQRGGTLNTITVGPGADCDYSNLQSAIWDAPDNTEIRLENVTFTGTFNVDEKQNLVIQGGYDTCSDASPGFSSTLDAEGLGRPLTIDASGNGTEVAVRDVTLANGDVGDDVLGGGLLILSNQGAHEVTLVDVLIQDNATGASGGGIAVVGGPDSRLRIEGDTLIQNNLASGSGVGVFAGGGLYCSGINGGPLITFDSGLIFSNEADDQGGGMYIDGCRISIYASGAFQGVIGNAASVGGGIAAARGSEVIIQGGSDELVSIGSNTATIGGGIAATDTTQLEVVNASIDSNTSNEDGGAFHLQLDASLTMEPSSAAGCEIESCSIIEGNSARSGGAVYVAQAGVDATIRQTRIHGNTNQDSSEGSVAGVNDGSLLLEGNFIYENSGTELFRITNDGSLTIAWSTLADNSASSGDPALIRLRASNSDLPSLSMFSNIVWNPGRDVLFVNDIFGDDFSTEFDCLVSNELATLTGATRSFVDDPLFVDAAADDYHVQETSPAIDACDDANPPTAADIDGDDRGRDFGSASAQVFDIGADEVWFGIFADRFEQ